MSDEFTVPLCQDGQDRFVRSSRWWKFWVDSDPFRSRDVVSLRIDPDDDGRGSALSAPSSSSASLAWNAFSNCRASATFNEFFAGRIRRAHMAAASTGLISLSSPGAGHAPQLTIGFLGRHWRN